MDDVRLEILADELNNSIGFDRACSMLSSSSTTMVMVALRCVALRCVERSILVVVFENNNTS